MATGEAGEESFAGTAGVVGEGVVTGDGGGVVSSWREMERCISDPSACSNSFLMSAMLAGVNCSGKYA